MRDGSQVGMYTYERELVGDSPDGPGDVFVESRMPGLEDGCVIFAPADEYLRRVNLANVEDGVYSNLDCEQDEGEKMQQLRKPRQLTEFCDSAYGLWKTV